MEASVRLTSDGFSAFFGLVKESPNVSGYQVARKSFESDLKELVEILPGLRGIFRRTVEGAAEGGDRELVFRSGESIHLERADGGSVVLSLEAPLLEAIVEELEIVRGRLGDTELRTRTGIEAPVVDSLMAGLRTAIPGHRS
ncbi:hypothetical protein [Nocardiopsis ansamitocini]|uniref:Uncharacterized protein n=1 Tax=Nocardiopsis ansamitocini TaxID=1670832 RepID=A0A9W6PBM0_9ACTN|nr:hypothetical protein [Nocardiopsis ansamitocini]GLU50527.1 hypothetical protein Nans01_48780 [Nocardiopsis ansamitocini]